MAQEDCHFLYIRQRAGAVAQRTHKLAGNGIGHITFAMSNQDNFWARDDKFDSKIVMFRTQQ